MGELVVTREYREDLGEQDGRGLYDYAYRYWSYAFNIHGRRYVARVYTDEPDKAHVTEQGWSRHEEYEGDLAAIADYLRREAGISTILTLGAGGGYEPWPRG